MKNVSITLNIVLLLAVGFLFYKVYSGPKNAEKTAVAVSPQQSRTISASAPIAYVELDSLNDKIGYIKDRRAELEKEQRDIESDWQNSYRGLENKKNEFLKRGNSITQQEAEKFQAELLQEQQQVDERKQVLTQKLTEKSYTLMDDIQKKLKAFLAEYNKTKNYQYILTTGNGLDYMLSKDSSFNITNDVIKGMNERMKKP